MISAHPVAAPCPARIDALVETFTSRLACSAPSDRDALADVTREIARVLSATSPPPSVERLQWEVNEILARIAGRLGRTPPMLSTRALSRAEPALRAEDWMADAGLVLELRHALDTILRGQHWTREPDRLGGLALASAALRGGLWRPAALAAFADLLAMPDFRMTLARRLPNLPYLDLTLRIPRDKQDQTNTRPGEELLRFYPDVTTLRVVDVFRAAGPTAAVPPATPEGARTCLLAALDRLDLRRVLTGARLARAGVAALEACSGVRVPTAIAAVASGELPGFSLAPEIWEAFCLEGSMKGLPGTKESPDMARPVRRRGPAPDMAEACVALEALLAARTRTSSRAGTRDLRRGLEEIRATHGAAWPTLEALLSWYDALLGGGDKPRTIGDYHGLCGRRILSVFGTLDPFGVEPGELGLRFAQVLDLVSHANPARAAGRIGHFARHATCTLGWPRTDLADLVPEERRDLPRNVRTAFVSPAVIWPAMEEIQAQGARLGGNARTHAATLALIGYGGLRLEEARGRLVSDVNARDLTVHVHCTPGSGIKSGAARRLAPVGLFAPKPARALLSGYVACKRRVARTAPDERLIDPDDLVERFDVAVFRQLLRETLGPVTPHDLRHGFLSSVHLLLYLGAGGEDVIEALTGWTPRRQRDLRLRLIGSSGDPGAIPRQLAALAGHRDPGATTIGTYCHLSDLALGRLIKGSPERVTQAEARQMLGVNARSLEGLPAPDGTVRLEDLRARMVARLVPRILPVATPRPCAPCGVKPPEARLDPILTQAILQCAESDAKASDIAADLCRSPAEVGRVIAAARRLMAMTTRKGGPRLGRGIAPSARFAGRDAAFLKQLLEGVERLPAEDQHDWAMTLLRNSDQHRPSARFRDAQSFCRWCALYPAALLREACEVRITAGSPGTDADALRSVLGADVEIKVIAGKSGVRGSVLLRSGSGRWSFSTLRRAAFLIAVTQRVACDSTAEAGLAGHSGPRGADSDQA